MATVFPTPPTFALPIIVNPQTGENQFNPIWLQWFLVLAQFLTGQNTGRIRDIIPVTSSGIYNPSNGTNNVLAALWGGGGGGGNAAATGVGQIAAGGGGGAGSFCFGILTSGFTGATLTIGNGGTAATNGGNTTFVGLTAGGGLAGSPGTVLTTSGFILGGNGGTSSGGTLNSTGAIGGAAIALSTTVALSGSGANSGMGGGGQPVNSVTSGGQNATGFAAGGSGAMALASQPLQSGGTGSKGCAFVMELS